MKIVWFRNDLRVDDNTALAQATRKSDASVAGLYFLCEQQWDEHDVGNNHRALMYQSLEQLKARLEKLNIPLWIIKADHFNKIPEKLCSLVKKVDATDLFFNIEYPVNERKRDKAVVEALDGKVKCHRFNDHTIVPPWKIVTQSNTGFKVFTAFAKASARFLDAEPVTLNPAAKKQSPDNLRRLADQVRSNKIPSVSITAKNLPDIDEKKMLSRLETFCAEKIERYKDDRDFPAKPATSELSAALSLGTLSPRRCFLEAAQEGKAIAKAWINELHWRDFYRAVMWHFPHVSRNQAFLSVDKNIRWSNNEKHLAAWKNGETGVPIVDAAMRQLNETGWMHNRCRMIVGSYLTKNLWIDWREGEKYFSEQLFDYDFASNNGGWQWCASVGTDAAPYFRVFNPASQGLKFDENATYIKQFVPELKQQSAKAIHSFEKKPLNNYPKPLVDLKKSRQQAIDAFKSAKAVEQTVEQSGAAA